MAAAGSDARMTVVHALMGDTENTGRQLPRRTT